MKDQILVKTPGKLMLAGEFAVLEPGHRLLVTAVDRFVYSTIQEAKENELTLTDFGLEQLSWKWDGEQIAIEHEDVRLSFIQAAMQTTYRYLQELQMPMYPISLSVKSELDDASGIKYGLGSSAAVVTGVVQAILTAFLPEEPDRMVVFKLASIAHVRTQGNGSGADIAASAYHGVLEYTSFQAEWLLAEIVKTTSIRELVEMDWRYLSIRPTQLPASLTMQVAWTGSAASTKQLVRKIKQLRQKDGPAYDAFLQASVQALNLLLDGITQNNPDGFLQGIRDNRIALAKVGETAGVAIETEQLYELAMAAESVQGAGKLSGAGGGDCGIAFIPKTIQADKLRKLWLQAGITPLDIRVYGRSEDE